MLADSTPTGDVARMEDLVKSMNTSMQEFKQYSETLSAEIKKSDEESRKRAKELQEGEIALERQKEEVKREKETLGRREETLKDAQDRFTEEQARCQNLKGRLASQQQKESDLTRAIRFQASQFIHLPEDSEPAIIGKIVDIAKRSEASSGTINAPLAMPRLNSVKYRQTDRLQSTPYLFWIASQYGSEKDIFENGQAIFNNSEAAHAVQHLLIEEALQQLSTRFLVDMTVQLRTTRIAILILQGLQYLRGLIPPPLSDSLMQVIAQYTEQLEDGFVLQSITSLAQGLSVDAWMSNLEGESGTHVLNNSNSDLAAGLCLVVDKSGVFMLVDTRAQVVVYVIDKEDIESVDIYEGNVTYLSLRSSTSISQELQTLLLTSRLSSKAGNAWLRLYPLMKIRK